MNMRNELVGPNGFAYPVKSHQRHAGPDSLRREARVRRGNSTLVLGDVPMCKSEQLGQRSLEDSIQGSE